MSDVTMLKKLLEAETAGRELVREAQETADKRVRESLSAFQDDFRCAREARLKETAAEAESFTTELERNQKARIAVFGETLQKERISSGDAERELRKILSLS